VHVRNKDRAEAIQNVVQNAVMHDKDMSQMWAEENPNTQTIVGRGAAPKEFSVYAETLLRPGEKEVASMPALSFHGYPQAGGNVLPADVVGDCLLVLTQIGDDAATQRLLFVYTAGLRRQGVKGVFDPPWASSYFLP
jgi:hypothetical protein